jgi:hypothetical protein
MAKDVAVHRDERMGDIGYKQGQRPVGGNAGCDGEKEPRGWYSWWQALGATLIAMTIIVHIVASVITVVLYFLFSAPSVAPYPIWYAPVFGALGTYIVFFMIAVFTCSHFATIEAANKRSYGLLEMRLCQLKARLDIIKQHSMQMGGFSKEYRQIALREVEACHKYINCYLREHRTGVQWVTGIGYINMWGTLHRAEEALIKIEPPEMVLRSAMHDKLAIQNSTIGNRDELLEKLEQAISDIMPAGNVYFKKQKMNPDRDTLGQLVAAVNKLETTDPKIVCSIGEDDEERDDQSASVHSSARMAVSEVRRTLNEFRDGLWEDLIRERYQLFVAMGVTALVTHILLCVAILTNSSNVTMIMGATAFYMVGAIAGLFGRFYNESMKSNCIDDYGLSQARLLATPLLSGLAGIGGVLITIILYTTLIMPNIGNCTTTQALQITLANIFRPDEPSYLLTAAVFGLTPNLIISSLQQRSHRYSVDLEKSKSAGKDERAS